MDVEKEGLKTPSPEESPAGAWAGPMVPLPPGLRSKTSLRLIYEAQSQVIQKQIGDLESVREKLGLNARKICQLLMVDPSAWNRWTRPGATAPPHIWRALQWYMIVQEKLPGLTPQFFIERVVTRVEKTVEKLVEVPREAGAAPAAFDPDLAAHLEHQNHRLTADLGEIRAQSRALIDQLEDQTRLLKTQAEQIQRLKMTLVVGLCLCFGLVIGLLSYQLKRASTPPWEKLPGVEDPAR